MITRKQKVTMALVACMAISAFSPSFAYCSNEEVTEVGSSYCAGPRCGLAWVHPENNYQKYRYEKECLNKQGVRSKIVRIKRVKIGCCD